MSAGCTPAAASRRSASSSEIRSSSTILSRDAWPATTRIAERVTPSVLAARAAGESDVDDIVDVHIQRTSELLVERSSLLADEIAAGRCAVAGLSYRLADGTVRLVASHGPLERTAA